MTHITGFERSQILLLPELVDDYVSADNPVRFIDAFVDELDLAAAGLRVSRHPRCREYRCRRRSRLLQDCPSIRDENTMRMSPFAVPALRFGDKFAEQ